MSDGGVFWRTLPRSRRPRFTVVEYLIGALTRAILIRVALPFGLRALNDRAAVDILTEVAALERAARDAVAAGDLAAVRDAAPGVVPNGLENYLPAEFTFDGRRWELDWDLFEVGESIRGLVVGDLHGAIGIHVEGDAVRDALIRIAGRRVWLVEDTRVLVLVPDLTNVGGEG